MTPRVTWRPRQAAAFARSLGARVEVPRRTGELRFSYPGLRAVVMNARRRDLSRAVLVFLRRIAP